jgi:hypothetical protein
MELPYSNDLPVNFLSGSLDDTTNSYKFYWLLAILEAVNFSNKITFEELACRMLANAWYPVNYFRLSFGKQDQLSNAILNIREVYNLPSNLTKSEVLQEIIIAAKTIPMVKKIVKDLTRYVPYRFIRPWFYNELKGEKKDYKVNDLIMDYSVRDFDEIDKAPIYKIIEAPEPMIEVNSNWLDYLKKNNHIITGFVLWKLTLYLQKRNPNVPNISGKLAEREKRDLNDAKKFWKIVLNRLEINCIYSGEKVSQDLSIDHFIPWSFVSHDLLWNLVPTTRSVNSSKSDNLPDFNKYFSDFALLQNKAFKAVYEQGPEKLLEDYAILFNSNLESIYNSQFETFKIKLNESISPLYQIAVNMGFQKDWLYI